MASEDYRLLQPIDNPEKLLGCVMRPIQAVRCPAPAVLTFQSSSHENRHVSKRRRGLQIIL